MDRDHTEAPAYWAEELALSQAELARGELVPASTVHNDIARALAALEAAQTGDRNAEPQVP